MDDDELDGCEEDFADVAVDDTQIDGIVLFADVDPLDDDAVAERIDEYEALFGA